MAILGILEEMNFENGSNYKSEIVKKHLDNKLFQRVISMALDKVRYTYSVTMKNVKAGSSENTEELEWGLEQLLRLNSREYTGNAAIGLVENILEAMNERNREIIIKILNRDLKVNFGRTNFNKLLDKEYKITKPIYMRCDIGTKKNIEKNISFPAIVELKADGTYRECSTTGTSASFVSRSGESYSYPLFEEALKNVEEGYMHGEMTVICDDNILSLVLPKLEKADKKSGTNDSDILKKAYEEHKKSGREYILPRSLGNGLLNSDNVPYENIVFEVWDFVTPEDYALAAAKDKKNLPKQTYKERFENLKNIISELNSNNIRIIEHKIVNNLKEAYEFTSEKMKEGLEGSIIKDFNMLYKDGTSKGQLKLKVQFEIDARVTGFIEGTPGTKREKTFGALKYSTDDGLITGSVSGFTDEQLEDFNSRRDELIGKVIEIEANDITKARGKYTWSLSHPRFISIREKDSTDTLERALMSLENSKTLA